MLTLYAYNYIYTLYLFFHRLCLLFKHKHDLNYSTNMFNIGCNDRKIPCDSCSDRDESFNYDFINDSM